VKAARTRIRRLSASLAGALSFRLPASVVEGRRVGVSGMVWIRNDQLQAFESIRT